MPVVLAAAGQAAGLLVQRGGDDALAGRGGRAGPACRRSADAGSTAPRRPPRRRSAWRWRSRSRCVGGMLLNLMPCVFPVLSLKVLGFAAHAQRPRARCSPAAWPTPPAWCCRSWRWPALLLALRAGGEQLGWGFQLQSPAVVAALAALFTLIGLNLAGVFEFGSVLPAPWAAARARHPLVDSLLTGVLAVAVASPCTAPFMGASLGAAVTLPAGQALAVFAALGPGHGAALPGGQRLAGAGARCCRGRACGWRTSRR